jgi:hypothetical protein
VGNVYKNKKDYEWKGDVDYRIALQHFKKHVMGVNNVDVFIHSWSENYESEIIRDYEPKKSIFEKQLAFNQENRRKEFLKSRWYSTKKVMELKKQHEEENNFKYDWVLLTRFDLAFLRELNFSNYDNSFFYAPCDDHDPIKTKTSNMLLDYWFFSSSENMDKFSTLYDYWEEYKIFNAHLESYYHTRKMNIPILYTFFEGIDHELVRALYEDCEYIEDRYPHIDKLTKYKDYPTHRF